MVVPIRVGIAGYGEAAKIFHVPLVRTEQRLTSRMELCAIATRRPEVVRAEVADVAVFSSLDDMFPAVDLVVVAGQNVDHFGQARAALAAGKHVVVEKPITLSSAEADTLIDLSRRHDLLLTAFHNRRWDNGLLALEECLRHADLGAWSECTLRFDRFRPQVSDRWREQSGDGTGMLLDLGTHLIYGALTVFGNPDWLSADVQAQRSGARSDDYFDITLAYGPKRVKLHSSLLAARDDLSIEAHGTRASFFKYGLDPQVDLLKGGVFPDDPEWVAHRGTDFVEVSTVEPDSGRVDTVREVPGPGRYAEFYAGVAAAILEGRPAPVPALRARNTIALVEAARLSAREGRRIEGAQLGLQTDPASGS